MCAIGAQRGNVDSQDGAHQTAESDQLARLAGKTGDKALEEAAPINVHEEQHQQEGCQQDPNHPLQDIIDDLDHFLALHGIHGHDDNEEEAHHGTELGRDPEEGIHDVANDSVLDHVEDRIHHKDADSGDPGTHFTEVMAHKADGSFAGLQGDPAEQDTYDGNGKNLGDDRPEVSKARGGSHAAGVGHRGTADVQSDSHPGRSHQLGICTELCKAPFLICFLDRHMCSLLLLFSL